MLQTSDFSVELSHFATLDMTLHLFWLVARTAQLPTVRTVNSRGITASVPIRGCWHMVWQMRAQQSDMYSILRRCQVLKDLQIKLSCAPFLCEVHEPLATTLNYR